MSRMMPDKLPRWLLLSSILILFFMQNGVKAQEQTPPLVTKQEFQKIVNTRGCDPAKWSDRTWRLKPEGVGSSTKLSISPNRDAIAADYYETAIRRLGDAFKISDPDKNGITSVTVVSPRLLCGEDGLFIEAHYAWITINITSSLLTREGDADPICLVGARFLATGGAQYIKIDKNTSFAYEPDNAEGRVLRKVKGVAGDNQEIAIFERLSDEQVKVTLKYYSPTAGRVLSSVPVFLKYCVKALPQFIQPSQPMPENPPDAVSLHLFSERGGFYWGLSGHVGLGIVSDFSFPIAAGLALGPATRVGYFFNNWVGLYAEPRFSMIGKDGIFGYNLGGSVLLQFCLLKYLVLALGPSIAVIGNNLSQNSAPNFGAGGSARIGADFFLRPHSQGKGVRAASLRIDAQPMYYTNGGLLTTIALMVGYESY